MLGKLAKSIFGSANDRFVKKLMPKVNAITALEPDMEALSDEQLRAKTDEYRERYANGESLDDLLIEAFATVREAAKRCIGSCAILMCSSSAAWCCIKGMISEMKTGEGKTLVATAYLVYLNATAEGKGVHVVTVNDYLAQPRLRNGWGRYTTSSAFQRRLHCPMIWGMKNGKRLMPADITYGTNNEFGFDYLRDNMKYLARTNGAASVPLLCHHVDEVDSILIDEARTPLIISGPTAG